MNMPRGRSAVILVQDGEVAVIERRFNGELYYLFPGGGIEPGETPEQAAVREAREELGLEVTISHLVAEVVHQGAIQYYFAATSVGGVFGSGDGEEMGQFVPGSGTYSATWLAVCGLSGQPVYPAAVARLIEECKGQLPANPISVEDTGEERGRRSA